MKDQKSRGIIERDEVNGIMKVAKPIGVVGCVTATTNPVINPMHNSMCALKCGNAVIICPHPRAKGVGVRAVELMNEALDKLGMPKNLIQIIKEPTMELSAGLMKTVDLCICTGGPGLVKVAYSSGKPALGVGQGNVQVLVDRDVDYDEVAKMVIAGRTFDNGVLCTCEQNVICPKDKVDEMVAALRANGAYYIDNQARCRQGPQQRFPRRRIQQGVDWHHDPADGCLPVWRGSLRYQGPGMLHQGLCPSGGPGEGEAVPHAGALYLRHLGGVHGDRRANLEMEGMGHSVVIHSNNTEHIEAVPTVVNVSRYAVNQVGGTALGGAMDNGLNPTTTLGLRHLGQQRHQREPEVHPPDECEPHFL